MKHACTGTVATSFMHNKEKPLLISLHWWNLITNHMLNFHMLQYTVQKLMENKTQIWTYSLSLPLIVLVNEGQFHFFKRNKCKRTCHLCTSLLNWTHRAEHEQKTSFQEEEKDSKWKFFTDILRWGIILMA